MQPQLHSFVRKIVFFITYNNSFRNWVIAALREAIDAMIMAWIIIDHFPWDWIASLALTKPIAWLTPGNCRVLITYYIISFYFYVIALANPKRNIIKNTYNHHNCTFPSKQYIWNMWICGSKWYCICYGAWAHLKFSQCKIYLFATIITNNPYYHATLRPMEHTRC